MEELHVTNKPKLSQNGRGPHPQRGNMHHPGCSGRAGTEAVFLVQLRSLVCQDRCAALSQIPGGWLGVSLNSAAKTSMLLSFEASFSSKGTICHASLGPDVQISVSARPR